MLDKLKIFTKNKNNLILLVLAGVLLMVITFPIKDKKAADGDGETIENKNNMGYQMDSGSAYMAEDADYMTEEQIYISQMEEKLAETLSKLEGAGAVEVVITLEASEEKIVEKDVPVVRSNTEETDSSGGTRTISNVDMGESTVFSNEANTSSPYVIKTLSSQIEGVVVLAEGAGNGTVSLNLSEAVQVLFGIEAHKIKVMKMEVTK